MTGKLLQLRRDGGAPAALSDEALVAACAVGEMPALGELFDRHQQAVHRFLARVAPRDQSDLDDLLQNTFLEAHRAARSFGGRSAVRTWLLAIAANVARHHRRGGGRRSAALASLTAEPAPVGSPGPDETAAHRETLRRLAVAIEELPHDLRVIFTLCELEGVPGVEAARALDLREGTVWRRLHDARKALRTALDPTQEGAQR